jgi:hypothetical protein
MDNCVSYGTRKWWPEVLTSWACSVLQVLAAKTWAFVDLLVAWYVLRECTLLRFLGLGMATNGFVSYFIGRISWYFVKLEEQWKKTLVCSFFCRFWQLPALRKFVVPAWTGRAFSFILSMPVVSFLVFQTCVLSYVGSPCVFDLSVKLCRSLMWSWICWKNWNGLAGVRFVRPWLSRF